MDGPFLIPLAFFAGACVIVAITSASRISDKENRIATALRIEEIDHQRRMAELQQQLESIRKG